MHELSGCISFLLSRAAKEASRVMRAYLAPLGVTPTQYAVLRVLYEQEAPTGAEVSATLRMDSATLTGVLDRLDQAGLLERRPDPGDRRVNRLYLTRAGRARMPELDAAVDAANDFINGLVGRGAGVLRQGLGRLAGD
ncbi:MAG: MarR family transcriptional regulator [Hyphomicrobiales bacterium]|nr:MarR family transcriptional regulator [Hyphomicrobiales bacterium]MCP5373000.1 MarR family transcriptional regulator [Hyphomicrobiales bacterium]